MAAVATMEVLEAASERGARKVIMSGVALNAISTVVTLLGEAETALSNIFVVGSVIANVAYAVGPTTPRACVRACARVSAVRAAISYR